MLTNGEYDGFDRAGFYRKVIGARTRQLYATQRATGIETPAETESRPTHQNYAAQDLFADDFPKGFVFASQPAADTLFSRKRDLGKRLFNEVKLSRTQTLACASYHRAEPAFTDLVEPRAAVLPWVEVGGARRAQGVAIASRFGAFRQKQLPRPGLPDSPPRKCTMAPPRP